MQDKGWGMLTGVFGSLYNHVTGYFGDILSYTRLMALMLAGSVIAQVFNMLAAMPGNVIAFIIISMLGNAMNFGLNLLGCYVHDLRLQCLEFFNKFYVDGGKPFRPMTLDTALVEVADDVAHVAVGDEAAPSVCWARVLRCVLPARAARAARVLPVKPARGFCARIRANSVR